MSDVQPITEPAPGVPTPPKWAAMRCEETCPVCGQPCGLFPNHCPGREHSCSGAGEHTWPCG
jgi:hypothetical protein